MPKVSERVVYFSTSAGQSGLAKPPLKRLTERPRPTIMQRGKLVILVILFLGTLAGIVSVWTHYRGGRRALDYFGQHDALLLRDSGSIQLVRLHPATAEQSTSANIWEIDGRQWIAERELDVTHRAGALYIRESLLHDSTYDWAAKPKDCEATTLFALVFQSGKDRLELILDIECQSMRVVKPSVRPPVSIAPAITFFDGWLKQQM